MKRNFGVAALLGLLSAGALTTSAHAQCGTGPVIILDPATFAYETPGAVTAPYISPLGNTLTIVGLVSQFCSPFLDLNTLAVTDSENTIVLGNLVSLGTNPPVTVGSTKFYVTNYAGGTFSLYQQQPRNAPTSAAGMPALPSPSIPAVYQDGTLLLTGNLSGFALTVSQTGTNVPVGSSVATATFTGGSLYSRVVNQQMRVALTWSLAGTLPPNPGYSAQIVGKFDTPQTGVHNSTWGALKQLYH
jgi:hypothetical protein